jgi:tetratricopeptide (TPR) repeat protein
VIGSRRPAHIAALAFVLCLAASRGRASPTPQDTLAGQPTLQQIAVLLERGDFSGASRLVAPALKAHPADPVLRNFAGVIAAQQGAFELAEAHFETAIRLAPTGIAAYENLARLYQERAGDNRAMRAKAIAVYRRLLAAEPGNVEGLFQGSFLLALDGQFATSRAMLAKLPEDVRQRPQALAVLAADLTGMGDMAAARVAVDALTAHPASGPGNGTQP